MKVFVSVTLGAALALTGAAQAQEKYSLSIATGGTGGVYYPLGGGMANILSKYVPGLQATAEVTGGSVDNLKLIATGKPYIAFSMADAGQDAYRGEDKFKGTKGPPAHPHGFVSQPHARGHDRRHRHHEGWRTSEASGSRPFTGQRPPR